MLCVAARYRSTLRAISGHNHRVSSAVMMASRPKAASSHGRPAAGMRPCGVGVSIMPMSAAERRSQALNGASVDSTWHGGRPSMRASSSAAASDRVKVAISHRLVRRAATEGQRNGLLAAAADLQPVAQAVGGNRIGRGVAVDHGLAHDFVRAETSLDHAVALHALEARARRVDAALRAHVDDVLEIASRSAPPAPPPRCSARNCARGSSRGRRPPR